MMWHFTRCAPDTNLTDKVLAPRSRVRSKNDDPTRGIASKGNKVCSTSLINSLPTQNIFHHGALVERTSSLFKPLIIWIIKKAGDTKCSKFFHSRVSLGITFLFRILKEVLLHLFWLKIILRLSVNFTLLVRRIQRSLMNATCNRALVWTCIFLLLLTFK